MTKFLFPIAINVINKAVDKIPEDLDDLLKKFVIFCSIRVKKLRQFAIVSFFNNKKRTRS